MMAVAAQESMGSTHPHFPSRQAVYVISFVPLSVVQVLLIRGCAWHVNEKEARETRRPEAAKAGPEGHCSSRTASRELPPRIHSMTRKCVKCGAECQDHRRECTTFNCRTPKPEGEWLAAEVSRDCLCVCRHNCSSRRHSEVSSKTKGAGQSKAGRTT